MDAHRYNLFRGTVPSDKSNHSMVILDSALECPACGDVWDDEGEVVEQLGLCGDDGEDRTYNCRQCGARIRVVCMVILWRYKTEVIQETAKGERL